MYKTEGALKFTVLRHDRLVLFGYGDHNLLPGCNHRILEAQNCMGVPRKSPRLALIECLHRKIQKCISRHTSTIAITMTIIDEMDNGSWPPGH